MHNPFFTVHQLVEFKKVKNAFYFNYFTPKGHILDLSFQFIDLGHHFKFGNPFNDRILILKAKYILMHLCTNCT